MDNYEDFEDITNTGFVSEDLHQFAVNSIAGEFEPDLHPRDKDGKFAKLGAKKDAKKILKDVKPDGTKKMDFSKITDVKSFNTLMRDTYESGDYPVPTDDQLAAVHRYQGHAYEAINNHARGGNVDEPFTVDGKDTTYGKVIDDINATAQYSLAGDTTLFRGTEIPIHQNYDVGEEIHSRSFLSTSVVKSVSATQFQAPGGSLIVINAKKGQRLILPDLTTLEKHDPMGEAEVLIPTESKLTITRIDGDTVYADLG